MELNQDMKEKVLNKGLEYAKQRTEELCDRFSEDENSITDTEYRESIKVHIITRILEINDALAELVNILEVKAHNILETTFDRDDIVEISEEAELYEGINDQLGDVLGGILKDMIGDVGWRRIVAESLLDEE